MDGCKVQVLQLEVSNDHQDSDKFDLGMHFHHRTLVFRSRCAGGNSHEKQGGSTTATAPRLQPEVANAQNLDRGIMR